MEENKQNHEYNMGVDLINIKTSTIVKLDDHLILFTDNGPIDLKVNISADFDKIDEKYHEIFMNILTSRYLGKVSFGSNPFSDCKPIVKRKWWQIWKSKYFMS